MRKRLRSGWQKTWNERSGWSKLLSKSPKMVTNALVFLRLRFEWSPGQLTGVVGFKVHFPQYVSMKSGPPAANVITANKSCNISQEVLCYIYQKVYTSSSPLTEVGVRIDIISLFNIRSRHNICSATIKSNNITFISFAFSILQHGTSSGAWIHVCVCVCATLKRNKIFFNCGGQVWWIV